MSDDICGAECADGTECETPAYLCQWHDDDSADPDSGRDFAIEDGDHDAILDAARNGLSKTGCARAAGVDKASLLRYLDAHSEFRIAFMRARQTGEATLVRGGLHDDDVDTSMAKFLLASSFNYQKSQEVEHSGGLTLSSKYTETDE